MLKKVKIRPKRLPSKVEEEKARRQIMAQERDREKRLREEDDKEKKVKREQEKKELECIQALELINNTKPDKRIDASLVKDSREPPVRFLKRVVDAVNDTKYSPDTIICLGFATGSDTGYRLYIKCRTKGLEDLVLRILEQSKYKERLQKCENYPYITMFGTRQDKTDKDFIVKTISSGLTEFALLFCLRYISK